MYNQGSENVRPIYLRKRCYKVKIVILDGYGANPGDLSWEPIARLGRLTVYDRTSPEEVISHIGDAEAIFVNKVRFDEEIFDACPKLAYVGVLATGYDVVDIRAATERGITVTNVPGYSTEAVAQHTFALLLELCSHVGRHSSSVTEGRWAAGEWCYWEHPLIELSGKTMGIVGYGRIGRAVAKIAGAFGMKVLACKSRPAALPPEDGVRLVSRDELMVQSDVVSLHCPLHDGTNGMICRENIEKMKDGAILINTARGPLVIEEDLCEALHSGKISGAALDVLANEPPRQGSCLIGAPNCIITPHIAWAPRETRIRLLDIASGNLEAFIRGEPQNAVN